jgi:flagellar protein FlbT
MANCRSSAGPTSASVMRKAMRARSSALARDLLAQALAAADADDGYTALKFARRVLRHEEEVLGIAPLPAPRREQSSPPA